MKIAIEGCAHGELDNIYDTIKLLEEKEGFKIDLLICCGDFQSTRNEADLRCMAVPPKYYNMCSFYKYYNGEKKAPILTIFIGGNHEASNYLQELPYGGWVAPNIYYLGYAGVINIAGIRLGGISGIYKGRDYMKGHFEKSPYDDSTKRSVYHIRNLEVYRLKQLSNDLDIFLSHDWPTGICEYGNKEQLIKFKPFFKDDIESGKLGSKPCEELLFNLKPSFWFAAHLHCKFAAIVKHDDEKKTKFLALDKCLPKRRFLQIVEIPHDENSKFEINYDLEWLTILYLTNHLINVKNVTNYMPGPGIERWDFTPTEEEKALTFQQFDSNLNVPLNFKQTVEGYSPESPKIKNISQPKPKSNPQTVALCKRLGIDDPMTLLTDLDSSIIVIDDSLNSSVPEDLDDSVISIPDTPKKLTGLTLPEPKMNNSSDLTEVANLSILSRGSTDDPKTDSSFDLVEDEKTEEGQEDTEEKSTETPLKKKFKRRNAEMYESETA